MSSWDDKPSGKGERVDSVQFFEDAELWRTPAEPQTYAVGFEIKDADLMVTTEIDATMKQTQELIQQQLYNDLFADRTPVQPAKITRRGRIRIWLAKKLYSAAVRLDPDLCNYDY